VAGFKQRPVQVPEYDRIVRDFFEPQLRRIGLAADQIAEQDLAQLEASLEKINDAIANPGAFGTLRVAFTAETGVMIVQSNTQAHIELGILPLLLERKGQILDRIRTLRSEQQLSELREDIASTVDDPQARDRLIEIVDRRSEEQRAAREDLDREQAQVEAAHADLEERQMRLQADLRDRKFAIYHSFLERESVASVVGALLLLALAATLIVGMFTHVAASEVIANAFLLILGYFFGQGATRERKSRSSDQGDT
jgi:hypothetical protein